MLLHPTAITDWTTRMLLHPTAITNWTTRMLHNIIIVQKVVHLWSNGQISWLQIQRSRVQFPMLLNFLKSRPGRDPLSLVRISEELHERKSSGSDL
jgi:hypothetical protein